jgi:hypothetical protein
MPTNLPPITIRTRIYRAITRIKQDSRYQKIAKTLGGISGNQKTDQALATVNGAPLSQRALNIKQVPPQVLLSSASLPDEPKWAAQSPGRVNPPINPARDAVRQVISRIIKYFPKPSRGKKIWKAAKAVISFGLVGAGGLLTYAAIPFFPHAAAGWLAVGGACLLTATIIGVHALISLSARNNTKKSFINLFLDDVKREILAEELLALDEEKRDACLMFLSHPHKRDTLKTLIENIQIANTMVDRFNKGFRDTLAGQIDMLLEKFRHPDRLFFYEKITQIKNHMEGFSQTAAMISILKLSYPKTVSGLAQARVDREFLAGYSARLDDSVEAELVMLHKIKSRLIQLDQFISELETQYGQPVLLEKPKEPR